MASSSEPSKAGRDDEIEDQVQEPVPHADSPGIVQSIKNILGFGLGASHPIPMELTDDETELEDDRTLFTDAKSEAALSDDGSFKSGIHMLLIHCCNAWKDWFSLIGTRLAHCVLTCIGI